MTQSSLLHRPVGIATRLIVRGFLNEAQATVPRLASPDDAEALHDFRVAIRRARSATRSWRDALAPNVKKRHRRALASLQGATGKGRDAEVMLAWITAQGGGATPSDAVGIEWLIAELTQRKTEAYAKARREVGDGLGRLYESLEPGLAQMTIPVQASSTPSVTFGTALGAAVHAHCTVLDTRLRAVSGIDDDAALHSARIDCKRLRYLLEPARRAEPAVNLLVKQCKGLQDVLGLIQDAYVLDGELNHHLQTLGDESGDEDPRLSGLRWLRKANQKRKVSQYAQVEEVWLAGGLDALTAGCSALAEAMNGELTYEIERKYLLDGLPPEARRGKQKFIDQGYLPGTKLIERVRRVRKNEGERYLRTIKVGKGITRVELEEDTDLDTFTVLWGLTRGRRVSKTRYTVTVGAFAWEIDDFADRNLVLAEIELPAADTAVVIPDWLEPYLVREVTDEGHYTNWKLAK